MASGARALVDFDIDRYLRHSRRLDLTGLDWDDVPNHPLADGDVMSMHYMMDIETHTVIYLRDLLATRAAHDPHVTAFLACWVYEELWHGEAFSEFLRRYGIEVPAEPRRPDGSVPLPSRPNRVRRLRDELGAGHRLSLVPTMLGSMLVRDFVTIHMVWGAINEFTTLTAYGQLMRRSSHPVLHEMLARVIQDERRHFAFYRAQGAARLDRANARTRRLVRWVFEHVWTPVGAGVKSDEEVDALVLYLFGDAPEGREALRSIDLMVDESFPGLAGMGLLEALLDGARSRAARGTSEIPRPALAGAREGN